MSKHTPGPWTWGDDYKGLYGAGPDNDVLSTAYYENMWLSHKSDEAERDANARLIAAAPELLEALRSCLGVLGQFPLNQYDMSSEAFAAEHARRVIAKVTGEQP